MTQSRKLAAIMFTDIVGYTALMGKDEAKAIQLLHKNRDLIKPLVQGHDGEWLKEIGDGTLSSFASAVEAVNCALEIQQSIKDDPALSLRIGIHIGDVVVEEGDVFGNGVNVASRLEPIAAPGGICVSGRGYDDIRNKPDIETVYLGEQSLKNVDHLIKVYALSGEGLPVPETLASAAASRTLNRRYIGMAGGFLVGTAIAVVAYVAFFGGAVQADIRIPTAVVDFINETGEPELDGLSGMLITSLEQSRRLSVVTRARMFDILKKLGTTNVDRIDEALGRKIAQEAKLQALVVASMRKFGSQYTINLQVMDPQQGEYLFTASRTGKGQESIPTLLDQLSRDIRAGLKELPAQIESSYTSVASVTTVNLQAYQHYFKGEELINRLKFEAAIEEYEQAVTLDSTFGLAYYRSGYANSWIASISPVAARIEKAHLQQALALIDRIPEKERYMLRALHAHSEEGHEAGIALLKKMERIYPDDKEMLYNIGDWSFHLGDHPTAVDYLERVLTIDPTFERALQHLTWTYRQLGEDEKMLAVGQRYVEVARSGEAYAMLGRAHSRLGRLDTALETLQAGRKLFPDEWELTIEIADTYSYQERYDQAETELRTFLTGDQPPAVRRLAQWFLIMPPFYLGQFRKTSQVLQEARQLYWEAGDTTSVAIMDVGQASIWLWAWHDREQSWAAVEKTLPFQDRVRGGFAEGYWGWFSLLAVLGGDYELAERSASRAGIKRLKPWVLSLIYSAKGECAQAQSFADTAFKAVSGPWRIPLYYHLADCQLAAGQFDEAATALHQLQVVYENLWGFRQMYYPKSFYLLGRIYEQKGDTDLALEQYEKFLALWKDADEDLPDLIDARARHARLTVIRASS